LYAHKIRSILRVWKSLHELIRDGRVIFERSFCYVTTNYWCGDRRTKCTVQVGNNGIFMGVPKRINYSALALCELSVRAETVRLIVGHEGHLSW
jgi:hypothetical protein